MNGILYFAHGKKFNAPGNFPDCLDEATKSARSLKKVSPHVKSAIYTDEDVTDNVFDIVLPLTKHLSPIPLREGVLKNSFTHLCGAKLWSIINSPFEKTLFVDSDTYILKPIDEVFNRDEDFGAARHYPSPDFPNAGIMYAGTDEGKKYVQKWFNAWMSKGGLNDDQSVMPPYPPELKVWEMPWHVWNVRPGNAEPNGMPKELKKETIILHSRWHTPELYFET